MDIICEFIGIIPNFFSSPFALFSTMFYIIYEIGGPAVPSLFFVIIVVIVLFILNNYKVKARKRYLEISSRRSVVLAELIRNIKNVKINSLETFFSIKLFKIRENELNSLKKMNNYQILIDHFHSLTPLIGVFLTVLFIFDEISTTKLFTLVIMFGKLTGPMVCLTRILHIYSNFQESKDVLKVFMTYVKEKTITKVELYDSFTKLPKGIIIMKNSVFGIDTQNTEKVLESLFFGVKKAFLKIENSDNNSSISSENNESSSEFDHNSFSMNIDKENIRKNSSELSSSNQNAHPNLKLNQKSKFDCYLVSKRTDLQIILTLKNLEINPGAKIGVMGKEDSCKSMFLMSIINETELISGKIRVTGKVSFLSLDRQFLIESTLRENIV